MNLKQMVEEVVSREQLAEFVRQLRADLLANPGAWENGTLESFLDAFGAWTEDMDGYFLNQGVPVPETPTWRLVAMILAAARSYE